jgi:hypothetical protein
MSLDIADSQNTEILYSLQVDHFIIVYFAEKERRVVVFARKDKL